MGIIIPKLSKKMLYKTATATVSCAFFKTGDIVSIKFAHLGDNHIAWYDIDKSEHGNLQQTVRYPENHLKYFTL